ncbi:MAG: class I SAM-dependent methyltransferase [Elusimicrobiota bacterium]
MKIPTSVRKAINRLGTLYVRFLCAREYRNQAFVGLNERPVEFAFLFRELVEFWPKTILDVGTGTTALPHIMRTCGFIVTASDNAKDYWPQGMVNRHYHIIDDDITDTSIVGSFDVVTCISVLEHIPAHEKAMSSIYKLLRPGGRLMLTCPYNERHYVPNVYLLPESSVREKFPFITQAFSRRELGMWLANDPYKLLKQEYWQYFEGEFWTCGKRLSKPERVGVDGRHQLCCMVLAKE